MKTFTGRGWLAALAVLAASATMSSAARSGDEKSAQAGRPGVASAAMARQDYILHCQGCHLPNATGSPLGAPNMNGFFARFLSVAGGRAYLSSVPGVANAPISDARLAQLLNWSLYEFDPTHVPEDFVPYSAEEVGAFRANPLITDAARVRQGLIQALEGD